MPAKARLRSSNITVRAPCSCPHKTASTCPPTERTRCAVRLDPNLRFWTYAAFAVLLVTGAIWLVADQLKAFENGEMWQAVAANTLMLHGMTAMVALILLGAMIPL